MMHPFSQRPVEEEEREEEEAPLFILDRTFVNIQAMRSSLGQVEM